jgi:hypothetical protein
VSLYNWYEHCSILGLKMIIKIKFSDKVQNGVQNYEHVSATERDVYVH